MFRTVAITVFVVMFAGLVVHSLVRPASRDGRFHPVRRLVRLLTLVFIEQKLSLIGVIRKLVYLVALVCFVVLAVTGFYPIIVSGEHISGYTMMVHATFAPIFAMCLAVLAVLWAGRCRFVRGDWPWFERLAERVTLVKMTVWGSPRQPTGLGQKITFWLGVFLALPLILSIILSMFPLVGTAGQEFLLAAHRWCALAFAVVGILHTYLMVRAQMRQ